MRRRTASLLSAAAACPATRSHLVAGPITLPAGQGGDRPLLDSARAESKRGGEGGEEKKKEKEGEKEKGKRREEREGGF